MRLRGQRRRRPRRRSTAPDAGAAASVDPALQADGSATQFAAVKAALDSTARRTATSPTPRSPCAASGAQLTSRSTRWPRRCSKVAPRARLTERDDESTYDGAHAAWRVRQLAGGRCSAALGVGGVGARSARSAPHARRTRRPAPAGAPATVAFHGAHQAGIATAGAGPAGVRRFDVTTNDRRRRCATCCASWTAAAAAMTPGLPVAGRLEPARRAAGRHRRGGGPAAGAADHHRRLRPVAVRRPASAWPRRRPAALRRPAAPARRRASTPTARGGDLAIQACADDPQVAFHAIRNLARHRPRRRGDALVPARLRPHVVHRRSSQTTPRNLMGFKDGTRNVHGEDAGRMRRARLGRRRAPTRPGCAAAATWWPGRSGCTSSRWDRDPLGDQEAVFGRDKVDRRAADRDQASSTSRDYAAKAADGTPVIPVDAHIRLAAPENNGGRAILRRGYSFTDGSTRPPASSTPACSSSRSSATRSAVRRRCRRKLGAHDALNEYIEHIGSAALRLPRRRARRRATTGAASCSPDPVHRSGPLRNWSAPAAGPSPASGTAARRSSPPLVAKDLLEAG